MRASISNRNNAGIIIHDTASAGIINAIAKTRKSAVRLHGQFTRIFALLDLEQVWVQIGVQMNLVFS
jgi:hypothetical protein